MADDTLIPIKRNAAQDGDFLRLAQQEDFLLYRIPSGHNRVAVQLDTTTSWTAASVVSAQSGLHQAKQYAFDTPVAYTAVGIKPAISTGGALYFRLYVSTEAAGSDVILPTVRSWREE